MDDSETIERPRSSLFSATLAYLSSIGLVVVLFFVVGQYGWLGAGDAPVFVAGSYFARPPKTVAGSPAAATDSAAVDARFEFSVDGSVDVVLHGGRTSGFYRVEKGRIIVEVANTSGAPSRWEFTVAADRLIGTGLVLDRQAD